MKLLNQIKSLLTFETENSAFELLENEYGSPNNDTHEALMDKLIFETDEDKDTAEGEGNDICISTDLSKNIKKLKTDFRYDINNDLIVRSFCFCGKKQACLVFINGMTDNEALNNYILKPAMTESTELPDEKSYCDFALKNIFSISDAKKEKFYNAAKRAILQGQAIVHINGEESCIVFDTRKYPQRSIETPENEKTVLGPREGFIENMRTNMTLIRRFIQTDDLVMEIKNAGALSNTRLGIVYRDGLANKTLVNEVKKRISNIHTSKIISAGTIEQLIESSPLSPLPQILMTERPDRCASFLMDGCVVLLLDNSPLAAVLPVTLFALLASPEDAYARRPAGTAMRVVRFAGAFISIVMPGLFTSIVMYHQGFLSSEVLNTLVASRKMVFIPLGLELIFLLLVFQLVREAGMRVPGSIGQAIGIIGGLVLGQAAVSANLASSVVLILVALTGLGNFCIPDYSTQLCALYFRIGLVIAGWIGGLFGFTSAFIIFVGFLAHQKSFGVPFLSPYAPKSYSKHPPVLRGEIKNKPLSGADCINRN